MSENIFISPENLAYVYKKVKDETANNELSNVDNAIFRQKAKDAGVGATPDLATTQVFKYKGSVETFKDLPSNPQIGDVYNVLETSSQLAHGVIITDIVNTGYVDYPEDETIIINLDSVVSGFKTGDIIAVYNESQDKIGSFTVQDNADCQSFSEQYINPTGLHNIFCNILKETIGHSDYDFGTVYDINKIYYFTNIDSTNSYISINKVNAGDNVVWTGSEWDNLAGNGESNIMKTEDGGMAIGNSNNKSLTENSIALGGGVNEEPNIAGRKSFLICGVLDNKIVVEYDESVTLPIIGESVGYAYPSDTSNIDKGWKIGNDGFNTVLNESVITDSYPIIEISEENRIASSTGMYAVITLTDTPSVLTTSYIKETYNGGAVRGKRIICRLWSNDNPDAGNYQTSESTFTAGGKDNFASGQGSITLGGKSNRSIGDYSITGGQKSEAWEESAFAIGVKAKAKGLRSIALGDNVIANSTSSFAGGYKTETTGTYAFAWGQDLRTTNAGETAFGKYNETNSNTMFSIGAGKSSARKNIFEIQKDGTIISEKLDKRFTDIITAYGEAIQTSRTEIDQQINEIKNAPTYEINLTSTVTTNSEVTGWIPMAQYMFPNDRAYHSGLLYLTQSYAAGTKINAIIAFTTTVVSGTNSMIYHKTNGITFKQIAGDDISNRLAYYKDPETNNLTFYFNRSEKYCTLRIGIIYNNSNGCFAVNSGKYDPESLPENAVVAQYVVIPEATIATKDSSGKVIKDTYATKTEVANTYATKEELNAKVSSVYKYKGNVENYESLPVNPNNGDVYNVVNGKIEEVHGLVVTRIYNTGYGDNIEDEYTYMYVDEPDKFTVGERVYVFNETGDCLGNFIVESSYNTEIGEQYVNSSGLYGICGAIMLEQGEYFGSYCDFEVNKKYYFSNIKPTSYDSKVLFSINPGANVAWTGTEWDILGGTVDLSNYVTKDEIDDLNVGPREATFEEIDLAIKNIENIYN